LAACQQGQREERQLSTPPHAPAIRRNRAKRQQLANRHSAPSAEE